MPLRKGRSVETMRGNVAEIMRSYKGKGTIGNIKPKSKKHAAKIAVAIAAKKAGRSRKRGRRKRKRSKG